MEKQTPSHPSLIDHDLSTISHYFPIISKNMRIIPNYLATKLSQIYLNKPGKILLHFQWKLTEILECCKKNITNFH